MHENYHLLKDLLKLRIRMICTSGDIIISELVAKAFIKFLQYLAYTSSIHINKAEKLYEIKPDFSVCIMQLINLRYVILFQKNNAFFSQFLNPTGKMALLLQQKKHDPFNLEQRNKCVFQLTTKENDPNSLRLSLSYDIVPVPTRLQVTTDRIDMMLKILYYDNFKGKHSLYTWSSRILEKSLRTCSRSFPPCWVCWTYCFNIFFISL